MSYATVDKDRVIIACEKYLDRRNQNIENEREKMIRKNMTRKFFWWNWEITYEQSKKELASDIWNEYHLMTFTGGLWAGKVEDLLALAKISKGDVQVDYELAGVLF